MVQEFVRRGSLRVDFVRWATAQHSGIGGKYINEASSPLTGEIFFPFLFFQVLTRYIVSR